MNHSTNTLRRRSAARRGTSVRLGLLLAVLLPLAACEPRAADGQDGGSLEEVLAFMQAGAMGDETRQLELLVAPEDRNPNGARVMRELHRPKDLRHFSPRSAYLSGVRNDTAWWMVKGTGPDMSKRDLYAWETVNGVTQPRLGEPTEAELLVMPRAETEEMVVLVRGADGWKLPLASAEVGPLLLALDSLDAVCPSGTDTRPCRAVAERALRMVEALPPALHRRWSYLAPQAVYRVQAARAADSLRLEVIQVHANRYSLQTGVEVVVVNRSAVPLSAVFFRLLDAEGSVLVENGSVSNLPARGRKEAYVSIDGRSFPRPVRVELDWVAPESTDDGTME